MALSTILFIVAISWIAVLFLVWLLCRAAKVADEAIQQAPSVSSREAFVIPANLVRAGNG